MSNVPEGATHFANNGFYYRGERPNLECYDDGKWVKSELDPTNDHWRKPLVDGRVIVTDAPSPRIAAHEFLERGVKHMRDRAVQRDSDAGERSMARAVAAFNAQEGTNLTEAQGWRFMIQLKYARAVNGVFVADDYEDMAAYAGLAAEAAQ